MRTSCLKPDEYARILALIGRAPTFTELGIFSAMWNEHCSYKSSRIHLRQLPTKAPWVIQGPGENAGVIDIGDGLGLRLQDGEPQPPLLHRAFPGRRDGRWRNFARRFHDGRAACRLLEPSPFRRAKNPRTRHLVAGVVAGIGAYGNSFGVPTVGGSTNFDKSYDGNILVNAMAVGIANTNEIFYAKASGIGNKIVYLGSKTGRDGIHGATMASATFEADAEEKRPCELPALSPAGQRSKSCAMVRQVPLRGDLSCFRLLIADRSPIDTGTAT